MVTTASTPPVAESPKMPTIKGKAGLNFVIPKNKLSGALGLVGKTVNKSEPTNTTKEEPKQLIRKTKWGPDLTQDSAVKRGRALALQTRVEQLAAQLESDSLDIDDDDKTCCPLNDTLTLGNNFTEAGKGEQLDLERCEAIAECMRLNPAYKPPSGFKPVLKEAKLYIPVKGHPGYDYAGLILGPEGNTQKQIEAETGAKITIRGKGATKEGKMQPARPSSKEVDVGASEELHVHISADTYEKLDAAVAVIEPLLIPKLQSSALKVICLLCGDGGHPTLDCPLTKSEQGKVFDKQFLSFIEDMGNHLKVDTLTKNEESTSNDGCQAMVLTAVGAQPVAPWMASVIGSNPMASLGLRAASDDSVGNDTFPRFLPPGMPPGLPRGPFLGPGFPMVERVLSASSGRPPFPPSFILDVRPLASASSSSFTVGNMELGLGSAAGNKQQVIILAPTRAASATPIPPFPPPVQQFPPLRPPNMHAPQVRHPPFHPPIGRAVVPVPAAMPSPLPSGPSAITYPMRPGVPSFRPALPSPVAPAGALTAPQPPPSANAGAGMSSTNNATFLPGNNTFPGPPQPRPGSTPAVWGQGPYSRPQASILENPPSSVAFTPTRPPSAPLSGPTPSGPPSLPSAAQMQVITRPPPVVSPNMTPIHPRPPQGQFPMSPNNQMVSQPPNFSHQQAGLPPHGGPQVRPFSSTMPISGNPRLAPPSHHHPGAPHQSGVFRSPELLGAPMVRNAQNMQHGHGGLQGSESSQMRPVASGVLIRADGRGPALQQPGLLVPPPSLLGDPSSRRPAMAMPSLGFMNRERNVGSGPLVPPHGMALPMQVNARPSNESWGTSLPYVHRPGLPLPQMQRGPFFNRGWPGTPSQVMPQLLNAPPPVPQAQQEVDPEYEKLMASVGVL